jgi:Na+-translocating ferredoxin:NAD+ oxidoreductase RnfC subunit
MEKKEARKQGLHWEGRPVRPHPMNAWRRTPVRKLMQRLGVAGYANTGALRRETIRPALVRLPLLQHSGAPAIPVVKPGQTVRKGDLIAKPGGKISAAIHASIDGTVEIPNSSEIIIKRRS